MVRITRYSYNSGFHVFIINDLPWSVDGIGVSEIHGIAGTQPIFAYKTSKFFWVTSSPVIVSYCHILLSKGYSAMFDIFPHIPPMIYIPSKSKCFPSPTCIIPVYHNLEFKYFHSLCPIIYFCKSSSYHNDIYRAQKSKFFSEPPPSILHSLKIEIFRSLSITRESKCFQVALFP